MTTVETRPMPGPSRPIAPVVSRIIQACVVVPDFDRAVEGWVALGLGPFKTWTLGPPRTLATVLRGRELAWSVRLGETSCGPVELEVIQPLQTPGLATEFIAAGGEGLQHVKGEPKESFDEAIAKIEAAGVPLAQSGTINVAVKLGRLTLPPLPRLVAKRFATHFAYFDTSNDLGGAFELTRFAPGLPMQTAMRLAKPDAWVPAAGDRNQALSAALLGPLRTVGFAVRDAIHASARWEQLLGVAPWLETECAGARVMRAQVDEVTIELAEPSGGLSPLHVPGGYVGFAAVGQEDAARRMAELGYHELWRGHFEGRERVLLDGREICGSILAVDS